MDASWDELDSLAPVRVVDSIDLELALGCTEELRQRVLALPVGQRDPLRKSLQASATGMVCVDRDGQRQSVRLFAAPIVLGYTSQNAAVLAEPSLFRDDAGAVLASRWRQLWSRLVPGAMVIPATSCVLLDEVMAASPDAVLACLQQGADLLTHGRKPQLRINPDDDSAGTRRRTAMGPVAATYLALAYVVQPEGSGEIGAADDAALCQAAELLQGLFAVRQEAPKVKVMAPQPFYEAVHAAAVANLRHFVDWGMDNDPSWSLDLLSLAHGTEVEVVGAFCHDPSAGDGEGVAPSMVRWTWDRIWWTDAQIEQLRVEVDNTESLRRNSQPGAATIAQRASAAGAHSGLLH